MNKSTFLVSRTFVFDAAHHLIGYQGMCANPHGHRYELTVTYQCVQGDDGIAFDFSTLKDFVEDHIIDYLDHHDLNEIPDMDNPTAENILLWCYARLVTKQINPGWLYSLVLKEGRDTQVELRREFINYAGGANDD